MISVAMRRLPRVERRQWHRLVAPLGRATLQKHRRSVCCGQPCWVAMDHCSNLQPFTPVLTIGLVEANFNDRCCPN